MAERLRPLVRAARAGDRAALNQLAGCVDRFVRVFKGKLSHHMRRAYGSTVDFVLEGVAEAFARLDDFEYRNDEQFYGWISSCIRSRIVDAARRESRAKRAGRPGPLNEALDAAASEDPSPSQQVSTAELRAVVGQAIVDLQVNYPNEMEAVVLKIFDGASWPSIREQMNLSSDRRARTLFANGIQLLYPRIEGRFGEAALQSLLGQ